MADALEIEKIMRENGIRLGKPNRRNTPDVGNTRTIVEEGRSSGNGIMVSPSGQMHSPKDEKLNAQMRNNPELAKAMQVIKDFKISA